MSNPWRLTFAEERVLLKMTQVHRPVLVARLLNVSERTIESHLRSAKAKMNAAATLEAVLNYDRWRRTHAQEANHADTDTRIHGPDRPAAGLHPEAEAGSAHAK